MYMQYTVQLHYTVYYKKQSSVNQKVASEEDLRIKLNADL